MPLPDLNSLNPQVSQSYSSEKRIPIKPIIIILIAILLLGGGYYLFSKFNSSSSPIQNDQPKITQSDEKPPAPGVIAKIGEELIYQKDLDLELAVYPPIGTLEERKKLLLDKMATDSAILQGAKADNLVADLDSTVYNSPNKDYLKRLKTIEDLKTQIEGKTNKIKGVIVSIWFYNFGVPAPIGYDQGKELALKKILQLQSEVKSEKLTIEQAAEAIKNDSGMTQLDPYSYKQNARYEFDTNVDNLITHNKTFNEAIRKLKKGETSDIFLSTEPLFDRPGFYQFATVTDKVTDSKYGSFQEWLKTLNNKYEKVIY